MKEKRKFSKKRFLIGGAVALTLAGAAYFVYTLVTGGKVDTEQVAEDLEAAFDCVDDSTIEIAEV